MSQHIEHKETASTDAGNIPESKDISEKRRHLLKGIGVSAPLMMTVASRPVLGAQCTPSAWVSGNLSDHGKMRMSCGGKSTTYWKNNPAHWAGTGYLPGSCAHKHAGLCKAYKSDGTPFHRSAGGVCAGSAFGNKTMMQVLWLRGRQDSYRLGGHIVAALLNAATVPDYGMSQDDVLEMYRQLVTGGYYQPSSGPIMTAQDCVRFIRNTF